MPGEAQKADVEVRHDSAAGKFFAVVDGAECTLSYRPRGEGVLEYASTYTPPELRGRGIAGQVVRFALEHARERGIKVIPSCSYVAAYIARHPEYEELVER